MSVRGFLAAIIAAFLAFGSAGAKDVPLAGLSYNPSGTKTFAEMEAGFDAARLRADLTQLSKLTGEIRTYSTDHGLDQIPGIAKSLGLKVTFGLWLGKDKEANDAQIARALAAIRANSQTITRIIVGNEAVQHGYMSSDDLIDAMARVREGLAGLSIPVGAAEIWSVWLDNPKLAAASDFLAVHILPYWDGVGAGEAPAYVAGRYDEIAKAYPGKPILIGEVGWPSSGPLRQGAVPSLENQMRFTQAFANLATGRGFSYFIVEAYDQPWKAAREGDTPSWGLFDLHRTPKPVALQLLRR